MKVFVHNAEGSHQNSYLVTSGRSGTGILIDPDVLDVRLVGIIESHGFYVNNILLTNPQNYNLSGVTSVTKVYNSRIFATYPRIRDFDCEKIQGGDTLHLDDLAIEVLPLKEYSRHAVMFRIEGVLFPGSIMTAGIVAESYSEIEKLLLQDALRAHFETLPDDTVVFPSFGPPSTVQSELYFNQDLHGSSRAESTTPFS